MANPEDSSEILSYDEKQITARLTQCQSCGTYWYMTKPNSICVRCSRKEWLTCVRSDNPST